MRDYDHLNRKAHSLFMAVACALALVGMAAIASCWR